MAKDREEGCKALLNPLPMLIEWEGLQALLQFFV
jgi:hypothetical protein